MLSLNGRYTEILYQMLVDDISFILSSLSIIILYLVIVSVRRLVFFLVHGILKCNLLPL